MLDLFCSFVFLTHDVLSPLDHEALRTNRIHIYCGTYCFTAVVHGGWVDRLVGMSMGSWVGGSVCVWDGRWLTVCFRGCGW